MKKLLLICGLILIFVNLFGQDAAKPILTEKTRKLTESELLFFKRMNNGFNKEDGIHYSMYATTFYSNNKVKNNSIVFSNYPVGGDYVYYSVNFNINDANNGIVEYSTSIGCAESVEGTVVCVMGDFIRTEYSNGCPMEGKVYSEIKVWRNSVLVYHSAGTYDINQSGINIERK